MEKFLYVFNYPPEDKDLCALEFRAMFKQEYTSKYYLSNKDYDCLLYTSDGILVAGFIVM